MYVYRFLYKKKIIIVFSPRRCGIYTNTFCYLVLFCSLSQYETSLFLICAISKRFIVVNVLL